MYIDEQDFPHLLTNKVPKIVASTSWTVFPVSNLSLIDTVRRVEDAVANLRLHCLCTSPTHSRISSATSKMIHVVHISGEHVEHGYGIAIFETKVICLNARHITDTLNNCPPYSYPPQKCVYFTVTFCVCTHDRYIFSALFAVTKSNQDLVSVSVCVLTAHISNSLRRLCTSLSSSALLSP